MACQCQHATFRVSQTAGVYLKLLEVCAGGSEVLISRLGILLASGSRGLDFGWLLRRLDALACSLPPLPWRLRLSWRWSLLRHTCKANSYCLLMLFCMLYHPSSAAVGRFRRGLAKPNS